MHFARIKASLKRAPVKQLQATATSSEARKAWALDVAGSCELNVCCTDVWLAKCTEIKHKGRYEYLIGSELLS